jgi:phage tail-like protein
MAEVDDVKENALTPIPFFRFHVDFHEHPIGAKQLAGRVPLCSGAFSECSGLEATMEPKVIKEGGRNYGPNQRPGPVTFGTVVLKRGMTATRDLWKWFHIIANGGYAHRLTATLTVRDHAGRDILAMTLERALPIKFKAADLNARGTEVAVEEIHLAHEGLTLETVRGAK